ncbi:MAG TPA: trypsin-like serine protease [Labilithrix sp.]|nr:trypsin-like serine protease [Labilithrix sp.]
MGGRELDDYPEVVHISVNGGAADCTGALVAPSVVLTAGHCVYGNSSWFVHSPSVGMQAGALANDSAVYDYDDHCGVRCNDVALLFLQEPIRVAAYPSVASNALPDDVEVFSVGKRFNGMNGDGVYGTTASLLQNAEHLDRVNAPFLYYREPGFLERGDSGGPTFLRGPKHVIVGVNAAITLNPRRDFINRLDTVANWIGQQIESHGGGGAVEPLVEPAARQRSNGCSHEGLRLAVGDKVPAADSCNHCTCRSDGKVFCTNSTCNDVPERPASQETCDYQGRKVPLGESVAWGCNTCTCREGNQMWCTDLGCH